MDIKQFKENLLLYGAKMHQWPEDIKKAGLEALGRSSEIKMLLKEYEHFEQLLETRRYEEPANNLAQRIISASRQQKALSSPGSFILALLNEIHLPNPALVGLSVVMILVLVIGFIIGFSNPLGSSVSTSHEEASLQTFLYDEGDII